MNYVPEDNFAPHETVMVQIGANGEIEFLTLEGCKMRTGDRRVKRGEEVAWVSHDGELAISLKPESVRRLGAKFAPSNRLTYCAGRSEELTLQIRRDAHLGEYEYSLALFLPDGRIAHLDPRMIVVG